MDQKIKEILEQSIKELLSKMDFESRVELISDQLELLVIKIESEEAGWLIGQGGSSLMALQHLARAIVNKKLGSEFSQKFIIDINNYRSHRIELLREMAQTWAREVIEEQRPKILQPMSAYERRVVHLALSNLGGIETESQGEEPTRRIVIKPGGKSAKQESSGSLI